MVPERRTHIQLLEIAPRCRHLAEEGVNLGLWVCTPRFPLSQRITDNFPSHLLGLSSCSHPSPPVLPSLGSQRPTIGLRAKGTHRSGPLSPTLTARREDASPRAFLRVPEVENRGRERWKVWEGKRRAEWGNSEPQHGAPQPPQTIWGLPFPPGASPAVSPWSAGPHGAAPSTRLSPAFKDLPLPHTF